MRFLLIGLTGAIAMTAAMFHSGAAVAASTRDTKSFDKDWKFQLGDDEASSKTEFDDSAWRKLDVPHDYSIEGPPGKDTARMEGPFDRDSPAHDGGGYLNAGKAWYRKTFTVPAAAKGKRVSIVFDGVYMNSDVYLNGKKLGNHPYGFTPFQYDLTENLNWDGPNTIAVRCNVEQPSARWYSGAGIYRHVKLVTTDPVHIAPWGTYITTEKTGENDFTVTVKTTVKNNSDKEVKCKTSTAITSVGVKNGMMISGGRRAMVAPGTKVREATSAEETIPAGGEKEITATCKVSDPFLWWTEEPYLYKAATALKVDGKDVDEVTDPIGFRTFEFTKDNGFLLNGKRLQIQGTCNHNDLGALGAAINRRALERQLELLKDMGDNALRTSHNPPAAELLELADEMGFVVMDEAFDEWKQNKIQRGYGYGWFFDEWSERDMVAMIHRDRNHPSIVMWSIGNEIPEQRSANGGAMAKRLSEIAHREDPTRPTVAACNNPNDAVRTGFADALDVMGINYNIRNYDVNKGRVLIGSETASALSTRGEYGLYLDDKGEVQIKVRPQTADKKPTYELTSYDLDKPDWGCTAETSLIALKKHPWMAGEFVWTGFDYIGEPTPYRWPLRSSYFGIIDLAGFPKDRFYIYQSQWATKPMVHLLPHWNWEEFAGKEIPVQTYTNADSVELFLNGKSLGSKDSKDLKGLHYEWRVPFEPGTLKAVAKKDGKEVATDEVKTAGAPAKLELKADRATIDAGGDDLSFVTVRVVDKDGVVCPNADQKITFAIDGPIKIAGLDNGDPINHESFQGTEHKAFHGLALAILKSQDKAGKAKLTATAEGLAPGTVTITTK